MKLVLYIKRKGQFEPVAEVEFNMPVFDEKRFKDRVDLKEQYVNYKKEKFKKKNHRYIDAYEYEINLVAESKMVTDYVSVLKEYNLKAV